MRMIVVVDEEVGEEEGVKIDQCPCHLRDVRPVILPSPLGRFDIASHDGAIVIVMAREKGGGGNRNRAFLPSLAPSPSYPPKERGGG